MSAVTPAPQPIIALVVRQNTAGVEEPVGRIVDFLRGAGYRVVFEEDTAAHLGEHVSLSGIEAMSVTGIGEQARAAVVVGGDGTMLGIARQLAKYDTPLIGINQGRLGFITDIPIQNMLPALGEILAGRSRLENRTLLEARVMRDGSGRCTRAWAASYWCRSRRTRCRTGRSWCPTPARSWSNS